MADRERLWADVAAALEAAGDDAAALVRPAAQAQAGDRTVATQPVLVEPGKAIACNVVVDGTVMQGVVMPGAAWRWACVVERQRFDGADWVTMAAHCIGMEAGGRPIEVVDLYHRAAGA